MQQIEDLKLRNNNQSQYNTSSAPHQASTSHRQNFPARNRGQRRPNYYPANVHEKPCGICGCTNHIEENCFFCNTESTKLVAKCSTCGICGHANDVAAFCIFATWNVQNSSQNIQVPKIVTGRDLMAIIILTIILGVRELTYFNRTFPMQF